MRHFLFLLFLSLSFSATAQLRASEYIDVIFLKGGGELVGTIVEYQHGKVVSLVQENGTLRKIGWNDVRRVNFKLDKRRARNLSQGLEATGGEEEAVAETVFIPSRKWQHQVTGSINLGRSGSDFGFGVTTFGGGFAYHAVKNVSFLKIGAGLDLSLMSDSRDENTISTTLFVESPLGFRKKHLYPIIRLEAGPSLPFGSAGAGNEIIKRRLSFLFHPSVGIAINPRKGQWGSLVFDVGYRFLDSRFTILTASLDELQRTVNYRRLVFRGGIRF